MIAQILTIRILFVAIDAPGGFLFEWWSVFWDIFIARTNEKHSEAAAAYIEVSKKNLQLIFSTSDLVRPVTATAFVFNGCIY